MTLETQAPPRGRRFLTVVLPVIGTVAAVVGAAAAVAVFWFPPASAPSASSSGSVTADRGTPDQGTPDRGTGAAPGNPSSPSGAGSDPTTVVRALTAQPVTAGAGLFDARGADLVVPCPTNQSDDLRRTIAFRLTRPFTRLAARVAAERTTGPDDRVAVQVFVDYRTDRSDKHTEAGRATAGPGAGADLGAGVEGATEVSLVVTCSTPDARVVVGAPTLA